VSGLTGLVIREYRVIEQEMLDGGGGGYRAVRLTDNLPVWLRVLMPKFYARLEGFIPHFDDDFKRLIRLKHPCLVPLYDFWHDETGAYAVTGYMAGGDLWSHAIGKPLTLDDIDRVMERITGALDMLHAAGFVHQEIRPGSVCLDEREDIFLEMAETVLTKVIARSSPHLWTGIAWYASPEQAQGKRLDARTDIYSLGVMLYELLTGKKPFEGQTPYEVLLRQVQEPLPSILKQRPDLPPTVNAIIQRATAKSPDRRYSTAGEMFEAWQDAIAG
jgi:eukaryotic-like serine/threonine-protein kinase